MVQRHGAQLSQTSGYIPSSTNAYADFLGPGGEIASTTRSSASNPINYLHPRRFAKGNAFWIGHTPRKEPGKITRHTLKLNP